MTQQCFVFHDERLPVVAKLHVREQMPLLAVAEGFEHRPPLSRQLGRRPAEFRVVAIDAIEGQRPECVIEKLLFSDPILHRDVKDIVGHL